MKKLLLLLLAFPLVFGSCGSDNEDEDKPKVSSIKIENIEGDLFIGGEYQLKVAHTPSTLDAPAYTWESSNTEVATVDNNGKLKTIKEGQAVIKVTTTDLNLTSSLNITVLPIQATSIKLDKQTHEIVVGQSFTLTCKIEPDNTTNKNVTWISSDETIATVSKEGIVTALSDGDVTITVSLGSLKDECKIKVKPINVTGIVLNKQTVKLDRLSSFQLEAYVQPENAKNRKVAWKSSNENIASVDATGIVSAKSVGKAVISAISQDGNFEAKCEVDVTPISINTIYIITKEGYLSNEYSIDIPLNSEYSIKYEIDPINADNKEVSIMSGNSNIASCDNNVIKGKSVGTTKVTIKTIDGGHTATYIVNVKDVDGLVSIGFGSSSTSNINGIVTGKVTMKITNDNNKVLSNVKIGVMHYYQNEPSTFHPVENIPSRGNAAYDLSFSSVNKPIFVVRFTVDGREYTVQKSWM